MDLPTFSADDGTKINYEVSGSGDEWIVFISGTGFSSQVWKPFQVPYFSRRYKTLISDHRGVGYSDKPDIPYSTRIFAEDITRLMRKIGIERAHIIGHSMGGRVAQWIALEHPTMVGKLVLAATGSGNFSNRPDYVRGVPLDTAFGIAEYGYDTFLKNHVESGFFFSPDFSRRDPVRHKISVDSHLMNKPPLKSYLRHVIARQMHETTSLVHKIGSRSLVLVGDSDSSALGTGSHLEASRFLAENIPSASLEFVKGAKHAFFWEMPEESNEIVMRFLESK